MDFIYGVPPDDIANRDPKGESNSPKEVRRLESGSPLYLLRPAQGFAPL